MNRGEQTFPSCFSVPGRNPRVLCRGSHLGAAFTRFYLFATAPRCARARATLTVTARRKATRERLVQLGIAGHPVYVYIYIYIHVNAYIHTRPPLKVNYSPSFSFAPLAVFSPSRLASRLPQHPLLYGVSMIILVFVPRRENPPLRRV